jgi:hypothetical protein
MKPFIASILLFILVAVGVGLNSYHISAMCGEFANDVEALSAEGDKEIDEFFDEWEKSRRYLNVTLHAREINDICDKVSRMKAAAELDDDILFHEMQASIIHSFERLSLEMRLNFANII